jgi:uncharacterized protein DUF6174
MARPSSLLLLSILALAGCDRLGPTNDFIANRSRWQSRGPDSYTYGFQRTCFCGGEAIQAVLITVTNDVVTAVVRESDGQPVPPDQVNQFFRVTIDSLFGIVAYALENADAVDAAYDSYWGYPTVVRIDYIRNAADDEMNYSAELSTPAP